MSTITVTGNLGATAELRYTPSGQPVLNARLGHTRRKRQGNEWVDDGPTTWYALSIWGSMAEALANADVLTKGTRVTVLGDLTQRSYNSASGGGTSLDIRVTAVGWHDRTGRIQSQTAPQDDPWGAPQEQPAEVGW